MSDSIKTKMDRAVDRSAEAEEYEYAGRKVKRTGLAEIVGVRSDLLTEERVSRKGNVLQRAMHGSVRRG
ncbi:MAG: hypothetical protein V3573_06795 [Desulfovibrionaceae bacterium]